jgi:transposase
MVVGKAHHQEEPSMSEVTTIGLDLAKHVFQVHGVDAAGATVLRKQLRRGQVVAFFAALPRCGLGWRRAPRRTTGRASCERWATRCG